MNYLLQLIELLRTDRARAIAPAQSALAAFEAARVAATQKTVWVTGCQSWYLDDRGVPASWPWSMQRFR